MSDPSAVEVAVGEPSEVVISDYGVPRTAPLRAWPDLVWARFLSTMPAALRGRRPMFTHLRRLKVLERLKDKILDRDTGLVRSVTPRDLYLCIDAFVLARRAGNRRLKPHHFEDDIFQSRAQLEHWRWARPVPADVPLPLPPPPPEDPPLLPIPDADRPTLRLAAAPERRPPADAPEEEFVLDVKE